jgi:hypothetical protein
MNASVGISALLDLLQVVTAMMDQANKISAVIRVAQSEERDITPEEWAAIDGDQIVARASAVAAVARLQA